MKQRSFYFFVISIFIFLCILLFLQFNLTDTVDIYGKSIKNFFSNSSFKPIFLIITNLMTVLGIFIILIFTIYLLRGKKAQKDIFLFMISILTCLLITNLIKLIVRRDRPMNTLLEVTGYSFPSSHSSVSMVVYGYLILLLQKYYHGKRKQFYIGLCCLFILLTGLSRIYFNVHYITDVIAGYCLGFFILWISNFIMKKIDNFPHS